jgi:hypothetical protein
MKLNNYFLPGLLAGFSAGVLSFIPVLKNTCCCLLVPLAAFFAVYLYRKSTRTEFLEFRDAAILGLLTGFFAAIFSTAFEVLITYVNHTNDFVQSLPQTEVAVKSWDLGPVFDNTFVIMRQMSREITETGFSLFYTIGILFSNLIVNTVFAFAGGLAARTYFNRRTRNQ